MAIAVREAHEKLIIARLSESEIKKIILDYVVKNSSIGDAEYKHNTRILRNSNSIGFEYEVVCELTIDLGSKP